MQTLTTQPAANDEQYSPSNCVSLVEARNRAQMQRLIQFFLNQQ